MDEAIKQEWVDALVSGEYIQGRAYLHTIMEPLDGSDPIHEYCCLGVACEIAVKHGIIPPGVVTTAFGSSCVGYGTSDTVVRGEENGAVYYLPTEVSEWLGITRNGELPSAMCNSLAQMNDQGKSFSEIAAVISDKF